MKNTGGIVIFGVCEILIGSITLIAVMASLILGHSTKPLEVLIFVLTTSILSLGLGIGILKRSLHSYHLLIFLASVIILSKILIFTKIITLSGALETTIPQPAKNIVSIIYHSLLIWYLSLPSVKRQFGERRKFFWQN